MHKEDSDSHVRTYGELSLHDIAVFVPPVISVCVCSTHSLWICSPSQAMTIHMITHLVACASLRSQCSFLFVQMRLLPQHLLELHITGQKHCFHFGCLWCCCPWVSITALLCEVPVFPLHPCVSFCLSVCQCAMASLSPAS